MNNYTYTYACRNIFNTIKTSGHSSLEKYTSHFIERVVCQRELETEQNCNILTPTLLAITVFLSRSPGLLNRGPGGPASAGTLFSFQYLLQLIWTSCCRGYIIIWRPSTSCERHNSYSIQPLDSQGYPPDIFDRMHLLFTQVHFFFWQLGRSQYATK